LGYFLYPFTDSEQSASGVTGWENSIAVLPFDNISNDPEQEYFCDGMTEQVVSNLGRLRNLKVSARQSVMKYKDSDKTIPEIGKELNVTYVLESSIRKSGDRIRVTAQLIKTDDGFHLWSQDFDRTLDDIFDIQDDISEKIASNLLTTLSPREKEKIKTDRPNNIEAWEYYQKGKYFHISKFWGATYNIDDFKTSESMLKKAIKLDPEYAPSYAALADLYNTYYNDVAESEEERIKLLKLQEKYINEGYEIDQNSVEVLVVRGWVFEAKGEVKMAFNSYKKAHMIRSNMWDTNFSIGKFYTDRGLYEFAIKYYTRAIVLNPMLPVNYTQRAHCYLAFGKLNEAEIDYQKALEVNPEHKRALYSYGMFLITQKKYNKAETIISKSEQISPEAKLTKYLRAFFYASIGEKDRVFEVELDSIVKLRIYLILHMKDEVILYLNEDFERLKQSQRSQYHWLINDPRYDFLRSDSRFQEILAKHKELYEENLRKYGDIDI
jgi:adenylate cyclase